MMQDYGRTQELVAAANNSAGASDKQYGKTLDSLQTSLTRLKNAWAEFSMGLVNNKMFKGAIDSLSKLLEIVNKLTGNSGLMKLAVVVPAMMGADKVVTTFRGQLATQSADGGKKSPKGIFGAVGGTIKELTKGRKGKSAKSNLLSRLSLLGDDLATSYAAIEEAEQAGEVDVWNKTRERVDELQEMRQKYNMTVEEGTSISKASVEATQIMIDKAKENNEELSYSIIIMSAVNTAREKGIGAAWDQWKASTATVLANKLEAAGLIEVGTALKVAEGGFKAVGKAAWESLGPYIIFAAIVAALIGLIYLLVKAAKKMSLAAKIEEAAEATNRAEEAAQRASEAYDELLNKKDAYNENQKALDELVAGTKEWQEQLTKCNDEVIELLDKYPDLAQYLVVGAQGQLSLNNTGWETLESRALAAKVGTRGAAQISASYERELILQKQLQDVSLKYFERAAVKKAEEEEQETVGTRGANYSGLYKSQLTEAAARDIMVAYSRFLEKEGSNLADADLEEFAETWGVTVESLKNATTATLEYNQALKAEQKIREAPYQATIQSQLSSQDASSKIGQNMASAYAKVMANDTWMATAVQKQVDALREGMDYADSEVFRGLAQEFGVQLTGTDTLDLQKLYAAMTSSTLAEVKDEGLSRAQMLDVIAQSIVTRESVQKAKNSISGLKEASDEVAKGVSGFLAGSAATLTENQWAAIVGKDGKKSVDEAAKEMASVWGMTVDEFYKEFYNESSKAFDDAYKQAKTDRDAALKSALEAVAGVDLGAGNFDERLSPEAIKSIADNLALMLASGVEEATKYNWTGAMASLGLDEDQLNSFVMTMGQFNWSDAAAWDNFAESIKEIYPNIHASALDAFVQNMKNYNNAIVDMPWEEVNKRMATLNKTLQDIDSGEQTRTFTEETYKALVEAVPGLAKEFAQNYDGSWIYLGDSMETLRKSVDNATEILKQRMALTADQLKAIETAKGTTYQAGSVYASMGKSVDWSTLANSYIGQQRTALARFIQQANAEGVNLDIGIAGLTSSLNVGSLQDAQVTQIISGIADLINKEDELVKEQRDNVKTQSFQATTAQSALNAATSAITTVGDYFNERNDVFEGDPALAKAALKGRYEGYKAKLIESGWQDADFTEYNQMLDKIKDNVLDLPALEWLNQFIQNTNKELAVREASTNLTDWVQDITSKLANYTPGTDLGTAIEDEILRSVGLDGLTGIDREKAIDAIIKITNGNYDGYRELLELPAKGHGLLKKYVDANGEVQTEQWEQLDFESLIPGFDELEKQYSAIANLNKQINGLIRQREFLEKRYQLALEDTNYNSEELQKITLAQIRLVEQDAARQQKTIQEAKSDIENLFSRADVQKFIEYDKATGTYTMKSDAYRAASESTRAQADKWLSELDELQETLWDSLAAQQDDVSLLRELRDRGREQFISLQNTVRDNLVALREKTIQAMEDSSNAINEANNSLLTSMRESIDRDRQARDNQQTERDLEDKQRRLAYLQQDSSGANRQEILQLQKEIADAQQSYQDTLVDQALERIEDANATAEQQRQEQIEIARAQLQYLTDTGLIWQDVNNLGVDEMVALWKSSSNWAALSPAEQVKQEEEFRKQIELALSWLTSDGQLAEAIDKWSKANDSEEAPTLGIQDFVDTGKDLVKTVDQLVKALTVNPVDGRAYGLIPSYQVGDNSNVVNNPEITINGDLNFDAKDRSIEEVFEEVKQTMLNKLGSLNIFVK